MFREIRRKTEESARRKIANSDTRVVQTNLVFVSGLSPRVAHSDLLKRPDYFGKFGKVRRVIINHGSCSSHLDSGQQVSWDILCNQVL